MFAPHPLSPLFSFVFFYSPLSSHSVRCPISHIHLLCASSIPYFPSFFFSPFLFLLHFHPHFSWFSLLPGLHATKEDKVVSIFFVFSLCRECDCVWHLKVTTLAVFKSEIWDFSWPVATLQWKVGAKKDFPVKFHPWCPDLSFAKENSRDAREWATGLERSQCVYRSTHGLLT